VSGVVELLGSRVVLALGGHEAIRLDTQRVSLEPGDVAAARSALLDGRPAAHGFRWGFALGVDADRPAAVSRVVRAVHEELVAAVGHCRGATFSFSFAKATEGRPPQASEGALYDGFHLDTHPEITGDDGPELLRVLVNLSPRPRVFTYARIDRFGLRERGAEVARDDYQVVRLPPDVRSEVVLIPPYTGTSLSYLTFWASLIPHVGVETPAGSFLASYEALLARS
jgi:hypothetical protein